MIARVTINGPFHRAGDLTAVAESIQATRRHMAELDACLIAKTSVLARPTRAVSPCGYQQWEFVAVPTPEEALRATRENAPRHFVQN